MADMSQIMHDAMPMRGRALDGALGLVFAATVVGGRCLARLRQRYGASTRVTEQLWQLHRRDQPHLFVIDNDKGVEHELVLDPRHRQPDVHPGTQLRCVDADFTF